MSSHHYRLIILLLMISICYEFTRASKELRIYMEPSGYNCFWQGNAPLCFLSSYCPVEMTTMKFDKHGDGGYCWVGLKTYCCIYPSRQMQIHLTLISTLPGKTRSDLHKNRVIDMKK